MRRWDAKTLYVTRSALLNFADAIIFTGFMVYQIELAGLTPLQLVLVGTMLEVTILLFEIPTGVVADVYSRRLSTIIGEYVVGLAFVLQGLFVSFPIILLGQFLWGLGYTFTSGATLAWLTDEVGEDAVGPVLVRVRQWGAGLALPGIGVAVLLGLVDLRLPLLVGGAIGLATAVLMTVVMPETGFRPAPREDRTTFQQAFKTLKDGLAAIRVRPMLLTILGVGVFVGLYSEGWDRLWQAHLIRTIGLPWVEPMVWFGAIRVVEVGLRLVGLEWLRRRINFGRARSMTLGLIGLTVVMVGGLVLYGLTSNLWLALAVMLIFTTARGLTGPLYETWTNLYIPSAVRATVLSMQGQVDAIGQTVGGPPLGAVGQRSLRLAFLASAGVLFPAVVLLVRALRLQPIAEPTGEMEAATE